MEILAWRYDNGFTAPWLSLFREIVLIQVEAQFLRVEGLIETMYCQWQWKSVSLNSQSQEITRWFFISQKKSSQLHRVRRVSDGIANTIHPGNNPSKWCTILTRTEYRHTPILVSFDYSDQINSRARHSGLSQPSYPQTSCLKPSTVQNRWHALSCTFRCPLPSSRCFRCSRTRKSRVSISAWSTFSSHHESLILIFRYHFTGSSGSLAVIPVSTKFRVLLA